MTWMGWCSLSISNGGVIMLMLSTTCFGGSEGEPNSSWLQQEIVRLDAKLTEDRRHEKRAEGALERALGARTKAQQIKDSAAESVADQAVTTATDAITRWRAVVANDELSLSRRQQALRINEECAELRAKAARDREALRRQLRASELVSEASAGQAAAIAARSGMIAARLGILAAEYNKITKVLTETAGILSEEGYNHPKRAFVLAILGSADNFKAFSSVWNGLKVTHNVEECWDRMRLIDRESALLEQEAGIGTCVKNLSGILGEMRGRGKVFSRLADGLAIPLDIIEVTNETFQLHEELTAVQQYVGTYPQKALEAVRRLDEAQKATWERIGACQLRLGNAIVGGR